MAKSNFDLFVDAVEADLKQERARLAKAIRTAESAGEGHPTDLAILKMLRKLTDGVTSLAGDLRGLRSDHEALKAATQPPKTTGAADGEAPGEMKKALGGSTMMTGAQFMSKALAAQEAGRLSGKEVAIAEAAINFGKAPPADIVRAVIAD